MVTIVDARPSKDGQEPKKSVPASVRASMYQGRRSTLGNTKTATLFQPNYRLFPQRPFQKEKVEKVFKVVMDRYLGSFVYDPCEADDIVARITTEMLVILKRNNFDRYRYVCSLVIGQIKWQHGVVYTSRHLWNTNLDYFIKNTITTPEWFAVGAIYAFYYD